ncbi:MAG: hypothetical protein CVV44_19520 [Spirochaetae bacterium HGW-Spirochaetae-1]|jgi:long-chain fatty acid transport protein|nr:MAG: hypothetical protein CVV44_19520 [Spirochaetae bacterium HGW-Spirochaetae-1]
MGSKMYVKVLLILLIFSALISVQHGFANIDYLPNQSAEYHRTISRNAATDAADIVNYNPAGTVFLRDGLYINAGNQIVPKLDYIITYQGQEYKSEKPVWLLPDLYAVYKKGNIAFFGAFNVPAGGGSVNYKSGVPMMPMYVSLVKEAAIPIIQDQAAQELDTFPIIGALFTYESALEEVQNNVDLSGTTVTWDGGAIEGSSMYLAGTVGMAVKPMDALSLSLSVRVMYALNTYKGYSAYIIDPIASGSGLYGPTVANGINDAENETERVELDASTSALGFGKIIGLDVRPFQLFGIKAFNLESLLVGLRFEDATVLKFKEKVNDGKDFAGMFVDGRKTNRDLPMLIAAGVHYDIMSWLSASVSFTYYFLKMADNAEDTAEDVNVYDDDYGNPFDVSFGIEYKPFNWLKFGTGYQYTNTTGNKNTYNDLEFSLSCHTVGVGVAYKPLQDLTLNAGFSATIFAKQKEVTGQEAFQKKILAVGLGAEYVFFTGSNVDNTQDRKKDEKRKPMDMRLR